MDRGRHRALLGGLFWSGVVGWTLSVSAPLHAQQPGVSPVPSVAVPPPAPSATNPPAPEVAARKRQAAERAMVERRQREQAAGEQEAQKRIDQLPPEEREAFKRNLRLWRELSPDERENARKEEGERMRAEIEKALQQTGLHLDKDQHEVFALRYRQERRRLERELQEKLNAERARRLPGLVEGLKKEFTERTAAPGPVAPVSPPPPPPAKPTSPAASASPTASPSR